MHEGPTNPATAKKFADRKEMTSSYEKPEEPRRSDY